MPQPQVQEIDRQHQLTDSDSMITGQILDGLAAAKQYERNRARLSPIAQERLMEANFPRVPDGDAAKRLTEIECQQLRASIRDDATRKTMQSITSLRMQMTEHHSLLDRLGDMTAKYEALQRTCQERDERIQSLEHEVAALKYDGQRNARRISFPAAGGIAQHRQFVPIPPPVQTQQQQMQVMSNQAFSRPAALPPTMNIQACNHLCNANHPSMEEQQRFMTENLQDTSPFCNTNMATQAGINVSPCPSIRCDGNHNFQRPIGGFSLDPPAAGYSFPGANPDDLPYPPTSRPKRAISNEVDSASANTKVAFHQNQIQGAKRFKSDIFAVQTSCTDDTMKQFCLRIAKT